MTLFQIIDETDVHRDGPRAKLRCKLTIKLKGRPGFGRQSGQADGLEDLIGISSDEALDLMGAGIGPPVARRPFPRPLASPEIRLIYQFKPRAAYETTPRLDAPAGCLGVDDLSNAVGLPKETASSRRAALRKLGLLSLKSHFFSSTYCFPRRASNPD